MSESILKVMVHLFLNSSVQLIEDMRAMLFERKMINQGTAGNAFQKKLTVNDYRFFGTFCIQTDRQQMWLKL